MSEGNGTREAEVVVSTADGVATMMIDRPKALNALTLDAIDVMTRSVHEADASKDVGVIVITGAGDRSFCVGADRSVVQEVEGAAWTDFARRLRGLFEAIRTAGKPVIARVDGWCLGGGHELHCFCDLTIASERSTFGQVGPMVGGAPLFVTQVLSRLVGDKRAKEIMFLCERYSAADALAMGLVNRVVPAEQLDAEVAAVTSRLLDMSPTALRLLKRGVAHGQASDEVHAELLVEAAGSYFGSAEQREAAAAFDEKRRPDHTPYR